MIKIGICDEDITFTHKLHETISNILFPIDEWTTQIFHSSDEIIHAIESNTFDCQLLFMDILIGDGLNTVRYIFEHEVNTDIIFITSSKDYVYESYHYHTFAYLLKPVSEADISEELQRYLKELNVSPRFLPITSCGTKHNIPIHSILYIESNRHKVIIHTSKEDYTCYQKLNELEELLKKDGFLRCHQSFLISLHHVTDSTLTYIRIANRNIPVSRRYQPMLRKALTQNTDMSSNTPGTISEKQKEYGAIVCIRGAYLGSIIHICPEQKILIGRDLNTVDIQVNLPLVSRMHCELVYHADRQDYEVTDYSSSGTYVNQNQRLMKGITYTFPRGTALCFGDLETVYKLA
ncbi:MAG: LytTR family transcriptional regulator DNA-binding domain-containing protein [Lachnospiraceae bacterium]|nr:LytTR family transcriptional regulator DNA-binding domain-containing protein [Lachnospiraceae bacterium]